MASDFPTSIAALAAEPRRLRGEEAALADKLQALTLDSFHVHVASFRCDADVRKELAAAASSCQALEAGIAASAAALPSLEASLSDLHLEHARLRRTLGQQSLLLELLEAPALMETCIRSGLHDEALDICEQATSLYFTHRLWQALVPRPQVNDDQQATQHYSSSVIGSVVAEIRGLAEAMRRGLLQSLSSKIAVPQALRLLGHLRRLYTQQAQAKRRLAAVTHAHVQQQLRLRQAEAVLAPAGLPPSSFSVHEFALSAADDVAIVRRLLREFLACRGTWHLGELELVSRHNPYQYVSRGRVGGPGEGAGRPAYVGQSLRADSPQALLLSPFSCHTCSCCV